MILLVISYLVGFVFTLGFFDNVKLKDGTDFGIGYALAAALLWPIIWLFFLGMILARSLQ